MHCLFNLAMSFYIKKTFAYILSLHIKKQNTYISANHAIYAFACDDIGWYFRFLSYPTLMANGVGKVA